jgi:hypothetical protein
MNVGVILPYVVPVVLALVAGFFGYKQAVKVADKNAKTQSEAINLQTYEKLNDALNKEITRLRTQCEEDRSRSEQKIDELGARLLKMEAWTDAVIRLLQHPAVMTVVADNGLIIPPPPVEG